MGLSWSNRILRCNKRAAGTKLCKQNGPDKKEPFIGTIATAPREDVIAAYYSSKEWLGNVDCQQIRKGSSVVIPVNVDGALLSLGDLHAKQGAGEMLGCAIESAGAVTMRINVLKRAAPVILDGRR